LANLAPAEEEFEIYDLERLLRYAVEWGDYPFDDLSEAYPL